MTEPIDLDAIAARAAEFAALQERVWQTVDVESGCEMCGGSGSVEHHSGSGVVNCPLGYDDYDDCWIGCKSPDPWFAAITSVRNTTLPADVLLLVEEAGQLRHCLSNLLAVIHRDGGHRQNAVGVLNATAEAQLAVLDLRAALDDARKQLRQERDMGQMWLSS